LCGQSIRRVDHLQEDSRQTLYLGFSFETAGSGRRLGIIGEGFVVAGSAADQVDGAIGTPCIVGVCGEHGGQFAGMGERDELQTVGEAGQTPRPVVAVEPYIVVGGI
jgi:hypothetical protein